MVPGIKPRPPHACATPAPRCIASHKYVRTPAFMHAYSQMCQSMRTHMQMTGTPMKVGPGREGSAELGPRETRT